MAAVHYQSATAVQNKREEEVATASPVGVRVCNYAKLVENGEIEIVPSFIHSLTASYIVLSELYREEQSMISDAILELSEHRYVIRCARSSVTQWVRQSFRKQTYSSLNNVIKHGNVSMF